MMILKRNKDGGGIKSKRRLGCGDLGEAHPRLQKINSQLNELKEVKQIVQRKGAQSGGET
jgi:uncharacterized protein (DUF1499 family)